MILEWVKFDMTLSIVTRLIRHKIGHEAANETTKVKAIVSSSYWCPNLAVGANFCGSMWTREHNRLYEVHKLFNQKNCETWAIPNPKQARIKLWNSKAQTHLLASTSACSPFDELSMQRSIWHQEEHSLGQKPKLASSTSTKDETEAKPPNLMN